MNILGLHFGHDASITVLIDGRIAAHLLRERISRVKQSVALTRSDIDRASYLLSLQGITLNTETDTHVDPDFLMLQMEYRESLQQLGEQPDPLEAAEQLRNTLRRDEQALQSEVAAALAEQQWQVARDGIRKWQFFAKLQADLNAIEQQFEDD